MLSAHQEVERLLAQIRAVSNNPAIQRASDQIEVLCRAYMEPDLRGALPAELDGIHFTASERAVLHLLYARQGSLCSITALFNVMSHPFAGEDADIKMVAVRICKLRQKLMGTSFEGTIETVWGTGYRMKCQTSPN